MKIIPAILTNKREDLEDKLKNLTGLVDWIQIDIIDDKFVKNNSIQLKDLSKVNDIKNFNLEAHLMVENPEKYFIACQNAGIKRVIFHVEAIDNVHDTLKKAEAFSFQKGIALNPETHIKKMYPYLGNIDVVLLMGVNPGFQGQKFIPSTLNKIKEIKKIAPYIRVEVDGGINIKNIKKIADAGADYLVVGSSLWKSKNIKKQLSKLKEQTTS